MRVRVGMRWWLTLAFVVVATTTSLAVAGVFSSRSNEEFRERAQSIAAGATFKAAIALGREERLDGVVSAAARESERLHLSLFAVAADGRPLTPLTSRGVHFRELPRGRDALSAALAGERFVATDEKLDATVVGVPLTQGRAAGLVAYAPHPDLAAGAEIFRQEIVRAAWWSIALGGLVGALIATLIAMRLRRVADAAAAIADGNFDVRVRRMFPDELGALAETVDLMRKRLQRSFNEVQSQRDRFRSLLERLQEGVLSVRPDLSVQFANSAAGGILGPLREGEQLPEPWQSFSLRSFVERLFAPDAVLIEGPVTLDDETYWLTGVPADGAEGSSVAVVVIADVSERERREAAEREFVTNASHELRTPLTTIVGAVEVLQGGAKDVPADRDRFLSHIEREAGRLVRLTRSLLVLARVQTRAEDARLSLVQVQPLLDVVVSAFTPPPRVQLLTECPPGLAACGNGDLLEQALTNLVDNALAHTRDGHVKLTGRRAAGGVVIEVSDTGSGMPQHVQARVFDRFYRGTGRQSGFGIGLTIVREAVRVIGGTIDLESAEGVGTTVRITLRPAVAEAA